MNGVNFANTDQKKQMKFVGMYYKEKRPKSPRKAQSYL